jgi:hypothetical protein
VGFGDDEPGMASAMDLVSDIESDMVVDSDCDSEEVLPMDSSVQEDFPIDSDEVEVLSINSDVEEVVPIDSGDVLDLDDIPDAPSEQREEDLIPLKGNFPSTDRLTQADLERLEPGEWLNDNLMDVFSR